MTERHVLQSWKEISNYTGRGIRTIQRYEVDFGFPVHRPAGKSHGAVLALPDEIDAWLRKLPTRCRAANTAASRVSTEPAPPYLAIAGKAKRNREMAIAAHEHCREQASRLREMMMKMENFRTACQRESKKSQD